MRRGKGGERRERTEDLTETAEKQKDKRAI